MKWRSFIAGVFGAGIAFTAQAQQPRTETPTVYNAYDVVPIMAMGLMGANTPFKIPYDPATGAVDPAWLSAAGYPPGSTISDIRSALDILARLHQAIAGAAGG